MNENMINNENSTPQYTYGQMPDPLDASSPVMIRRKVKSSYNWAGSAILWQQGFVIVFTFVMGIIMAFTAVPKIMEENPNISQQELQAALTEQTTSIGSSAIILNAVAMTAADIIVVLMLFLAAKKFTLRSVMGRPDRVSPSTIALAAVGAFGVQGVSIFIQMAVMSLTGYTGVNQATSSALSFSDDTVNNIVLLLYTVILAPIFEEIIFRGAVLNLCAPVNRKFAVIVSALLFGLMHCNFNQIFNGFLLGLVFGYIAVKSGSIVSSIICHICANANGMIVSYICELKLAPSVGIDKAGTIEMIVFAVEAVVGIIALVILLKKNGKIKDTDIIAKDYTFEIDGTDAKKLTWSAMLKSPTFWVSAALCIASAAIAVTPVAGNIQQ